MTTFIHTLRPLTLESDAHIYAPPRAAVEPLDLDTPALEAMTDLRRTRVVTIAPEVTVDAALTLMIHAQVRLLLVVNGDAMIVGLVSSVALAHGSVVKALAMVVLGLLLGLVGTDIYSGTPRGPSRAGFTAASWGVPAGMLLMDAPWAW